ncbi:MAG: alkaline phosphatase family protein [Anditalea sp.]
MNKMVWLVCFLLAGNAVAQKTENVVLITLDGLRWQELYGGADSLLVDDSGYVENPEALVEEFWDADPLKRRKMLMPFFWNTIALKGQLYGNRKYDNKVDCSNEMWFSYPGYNEILTGFADNERINSNSKVNNPNVTILEYLNNRQEFKGKVAAFGSWDVFPFIVNRDRSGIPVNAGFEKASQNPTEVERFLNKIQDEIRGPWGGVRLDIFTHHFAMEELKKNKPKVLFIAYGETDDYAHGGEYDQYLKSAKQTDAYIKEVWDFIQSNPQYKDKTTLIITTDHGRGTQPKSTWKSHGTNIPDAGQIWIAVMGPDSPALGEVKKAGQLYQNQVARTLSTALGVVYDQEKAGAAMPSAFE